MTAEQLTKDEVAEFLGDARDVEPLTGGAWSSAWAYRANGEELVVRFGRETAWYEADRMAMDFAGPDLPVPEVREVGRTPDGRAYAISVRHHGSFLEDTPVERAAAIAQTLTRLLVALYRVPSSPDLPVTWHQGGENAASWREFLLSGLIDDPAKLVHGWSTELAADPELAPLAEKSMRRITELVDACPERRDLIHGDLLHGNVLVSQDSSRIEAVLSWKCSVRGDFLFDVAWCTFWSSFHPGIAAADPISHVVKALRHEPDALRDAAIRHHCYQLHIGYTHLGWNIWTGDRESLMATARRLTDIIDRGPLPLD